MEGVGVGVDRLAVTAGAEARTQTSTITANPSPYQPTPSTPHPDEKYNTCWRAACLHRKCLNCALYAGPLSRADPGAKLLIRTVGGLYASPRYLDPVYWECGACHEWMCNRFDSRSALGATPCKNRDCLIRLGAAAAAGQLGMGGMRMGAFPYGGAGGVLVAESMVMNRYGERLGTADQRVAVADGPWDWQRRALGDPRCAVVAGLRGTMKRAGDAMQLDNVGGGRGRALADPGRLWKAGEPVPAYPYRRPPPVDGNDTAENNEYEDSYLTGMPTEPLDKGKGPEGQYTGPNAAVSPETSSPSTGYFPGWNHMQM